jgi:hypothetical protein
MPNWKGWEADGSAENCVRNITVHLNVLLTAEQKEAINWEEGQSVSLAVMRVIGWLLNEPSEERTTAP